MRFSWPVTAANATSAATALIGCAALGAALTACSVDAKLDVVNECGTDIRVYSGAHDARSGTMTRVDELAPHQTAATYVSDDNTVIYVQPTHSDTWWGPYEVPSDADGDGLVTYTVQADMCGGVAAG